MYTYVISSWHIMHVHMYMYRMSSVIVIREKQTARVNCEIIIYYIFQSQSFKDSIDNGFSIIDPYDLVRITETKHSIWFRTNNLYALTTTFFIQCFHTSSFSFYDAHPQLVVEFVTYNIEYCQLLREGSLPDSETRGINFFTSTLVSQVTSNNRCLHHPSFIVRFWDSKTGNPN